MMILRVLPVCLSVGPLLSLLLVVDGRDEGSARPRRRESSLEIGVVQ